MNKFYGWAISGHLPYGGFKSLKIVDNFNVNSVSENSPAGYILEVDLEYSDELRLFHNDYPLTPEKLASLYKMLSEYCKKVADRHEIKVGDVKKLIPNLRRKTNYVVHYRNLQLYFSLGTKLTKTHRVLTFKQSNWMENCINFNTAIRTNAANNFDFFFFN